MGAIAKQKNLAPSQQNYAKKFGLPPAPDPARAVSAALIYIL